MSDQPLHIDCDEHITRLETENEGLRAYAGALRGDLVAIDGAFASSDWDALDLALGRHLRGTLDEDVLALARETLERS